MTPLSSPLKPKSQWDRFRDLKQCTAIKVAVRVLPPNNHQDAASDDANTVGETNDATLTTTSQGTAVTTENNRGEWMPVGRVRALNDTLEGQISALVLQRGLIAEHAKRLYPLKILAKDRVEWGYQIQSSVNNGSSTGEEEEQGQESWTAVNVKKVMSDDSTNALQLDVKNIGFEGIPDPASGYYCHYDHSSKGTKVLNLNYEKGEPNSKGARAL